MPYKFPVVNFDWLGELPDIKAKADERRSTKEALADLDPSTAEGLRLGAQKAFRAGNAELGLRLENAARERQALGHRISEDVQARQGMPGLVEALRGLGAPPAPAAEQPAKAPAPDYPWPTPGAQSAIPVPSVAQGAPPPPDVAASASPSETLLAAAEGQGPALPALGPQLAQAGGQPPLPSVAPPPGAPAGQPAWLQGAQAPVMPPRPQAVPRPPAAAPRPAAPTGEAQQLFEVISRLPKNVPPGIVQGLMTRYRDALEREKEGRKLTPDQTEHVAINAERARQGLPPRSFEESQAIKADKAEDIKEVRGIFKDISKEGKSSREMLDAISGMEKIVSHPAFTSGTGAALYGSAISGLQVLGDIAGQYGIKIPEEIANLSQSYRQAKDDSAKARIATKLQETFTALSNQLIYAKMGSLGNQISNADREFIQKVFPSLSTSVEGNKLLLKYMRRVAETGAQNFKDAIEYRKNTKAHELNAADMEFYLEQKREQRRLFTNPDGSPTTLGNEFANQLTPELLEGPTPPPVLQQPPRSGLGPMPVGPLRLMGRP